MKKRRKISTWIRAPPWVSTTKNKRNIKGENNERNDRNRYNGLFS